MLRRCLVLVLVAATAIPAVAEGRKRSPRLHAFRSCSNLLDYAQRHGVRVIGDSPVLRDGGTGGGVMPPQGGAPVAGPEPAVGPEADRTSPTNVQELSLIHI